jgi:hypothetical protein
MSMHDAALAYARDLRERGYQDVSVWEYNTPMDNRDPSNRAHKTAFGYAVRYTSSEAIDREVSKGTPAGKLSVPRKFHDRSVTVFCGNGLEQYNLIGNGILADFLNEEIAPMWVSHWSPSLDTPGVRRENVPDYDQVGMRRFTTRETVSNYEWQLGPRKYYHLIMTPVPERRFTRGDEPAAMTDR